MNYVPNQIFSWPIIPLKTVTLLCLWNKVLQAISTYCLNKEYLAVFQLVICWFVQYVYVELATNQWTEIEGIKFKWSARLPWCKCVPVKSLQTICMYHKISLSALMPLIILFPTFILLLIICSSSSFLGATVFIAAGEELPTWAEFAHWQKGEELMRSVFYMSHLTG